MGRPLGEQGSPCRRALVGSLFSHYFGVVTKSFKKKYSTSGPNYKKKLSSSLRRNTITVLVEDPYKEYIFFGWVYNGKGLKLEEHTKRSYSLIRGRINDK